MLNIPIVTSFLLSFRTHFNKMRIFTVCL